MNYDIRNQFEEETLQAIAGAEKAMRKFPIEYRVASLIRERGFLIGHPLGEMEIPGINPGNMAILLPEKQTWMSKLKEGARLPWYLGVLYLKDSVKGADYDKKWVIESFTEEHKTPLTGLIESVRDIINSDINLTVSSLDYNQTVRALSWEEGIKRRKEKLFEQEKKERINRSVK